MTVSIVDPGPLGMLLGALLHLKGTPVSFQPMTAAPAAGRIRVNLPGGRLLVDGLVEGPSAPESTFFLLGEGPGGTERETFKRLTERAGRAEVLRGALINPIRDGGERPNSGAGQWETCLVLAEPVMLDTACVELSGPESAIVTSRGSMAAGLFSSLDSLGFSIHEVEDVGACLNSYRVLRLLDLPVAMCNTTRDHFLSFPEGRQIAGHVLEEGLRACRKLGGKLERLPVGDPAELLRRIGRTPRAFETARFLPDRRYNPTLQSLMRGGGLDSRSLNRRIVEKAAGVGLTLEWNWKLSQKVSRVHGAGFFPGPSELLAAIG